MIIKDMIGSKYIRYGILSFLIFSLLTSVTITVSAEQVDHNNTGNKSCTDCHSGHQDKFRQNDKQIKIPKIDKIQKSTVLNVGTYSVTNVIGNITLVASMGQDWFQQGIFGPGFPVGVDKSWGWTFFDENPQSEFIIPYENVTQRNNIYALLLDDGNNSNPITGATVVANVTYWIYNGTNYTSNLSNVSLVEDTTRRGFYSGRFDFYGGTSYAGYGMRYCDGCHSSIYGVPDTEIGYFPGNYTVSIRAGTNGKTKITNTSFEVTAWGCEDCHGSGNRHRASADMDSACYTCHGVNDITGMSDAGNPHQNAAHRDIQCTACHTNKSLNSTFNGVTFTSGGLNGNVPQYNYSVMQLNKGKHSTMICTDCHNSLTLPSPQGGHGNYIVNGTVNSYDPSFASIKQFQDYYVINVSSDSLNISLDWDSGANLGFYLYPPDFNPKNDIRPPYYDGAASTGNTPETYNSSNPMNGSWILQVYGYDLRYDFPGWNSWGGVLQPPINYTVRSTYPIQKKDLPSTPECNNCHSPNGQGNANTKYDIPSWNPGYAHADTNGDGNLDVQCRLCHDSIHNIDIKNCRDCHNNVPTGHVIVEPQYSQYTTSQCLLCHGDPHKVSAQAEACIECHGIGYEGANPVAITTLVNISVFNTSIHQNINDSINKDYRVTNDDCWQCHYNKDMNRQNVRKCGYCHNNAPQWHGNANVATNLTELSIR